MSEVPLKIETDVMRVHELTQRFTQAAHGYNLPEVALALAAMMAMAGDLMNVIAEARKKRKNQ